MKDIPFRTFTGRVVDLWNPKSEDIDLVDMAHGLSRICRYTGAIKEHYSVAQHCWLVSKWLESIGEPPLVQLEGHTHDSAEYLTGDLHGPTKIFFKKHCDIWDKLEVRNEEAIGNRFNIQIYPMKPIVHLADKVLLKAEKKQLLLDEAHWSILDNVPDWDFKIVPWPAEWARQRYIERFCELWSVR